MKAIGLNEFGGPEVLRVVDLAAGGVRGRLVLDFSQPI